MVKDNYNYPMIFTYLDKEVKIRAVDFEECSTSVEGEKDQIQAAMDLLSESIMDYEKKKKKLPSTTDISNIELKENEKLLYVNAWMPYFRNRD
ncbi:hypothetical protein [Clostridium vincentii]|uniref:HicB-like antitoxin of toxin-antitoxin system domain-containing protein n=1 Tax=Clostridium vincentii TaxID=52704 RepID=A0A2T0BET9_9CLOT|nr:hypothetical protein [Clostridium vincentii]PRR82343.1 hypothetical protein CLVI_18490 [Clostridium vincentii]